MNMMEQAARQMPHMMGNMGQMLHTPMAGGAMLAAGSYAAGKGLLGGLLRNPLVFVAAGLAAGYLLHKYEKEIVQAVAQATGMGRDLMLHQKENLDDLIAETQSAPGAATMPMASIVPATPAQE